MSVLKRMLLLALVAVLALVGVIVVGANRTYQQVAALPSESPTSVAEGIQRLDMRFPCGNAECAGSLYLPSDDQKPGVVVMAHGYACTGDVGLPSFAARFARDGIAAFVFDYRRFGASGGSPRQLVNPWHQLEDWKAAIDYVRALEQIDGKRLALWGSSLGGGLALVAAARDGNVVGVVAQAPQIDTATEGEATSPGAFALMRLLFTAWGDLAFSAFGADPTTVPAIAPSGQFAMISDDAAFRAFTALTPGTRYQNAVAARSIFTFDDYNPAILAAEIKLPILLIASPSDRFAPFDAVKTFALEHPTASLEEVSGDHFDIYSGPNAERAANLASSFLAARFR